MRSQTRVIVTGRLHDGSGFVTIEAYPATAGIPSAYQAQASIPMYLGGTTVGVALAEALMQSASLVIAATAVSKSGVTFGR